MTEHTELLDALKSLVAEIQEYERINNLAPSPGKPDCWQSVTRAKAIIAKAARGNRRTPRRNMNAMVEALNYVADMTWCGTDAEWHFKSGYDPQVVLDALAAADSVSTDKQRIDELEGAMALAMQALGAIAERAHEDKIADLAAFAESRARRVFTPKDGAALAAQDQPASPGQDEFYAVAAAIAGDNSCAGGEYKDRFCAVWKHLTSLRTAQPQSQSDQRAEGDGT